MTWVMLGWNHRVRNVPVSSRTAKQYRATSPSRNDQWSGNTLRSAPFTLAAARRRSSAHPAAVLLRLVIAAAPPRLRRFRN